MTASMFKCPFNIEHGVVAMLGRGRERRSELGFNHLKTLKGSVRFGVQSIKHANVLSEKINFSALGGSKVAIFGGDDLDPIYFEVHMFLNPPGPPYMSKNAKMCYF